MTLKTASILLAHGSSDPHWLAPFDQLLQRIRDSLSDPDGPVPTYLDLLSVTTETVAKGLTE